MSIQILQERHDMSETVELIPCPFCGAVGIGRQFRNVDEIDIDHKEDCFLTALGHSGQHMHNHCNGETGEKGILFKHWNTRNV